MSEASTQSAPGRLDALIIGAGVARRVGDDGRAVGLSPGAAADRGGA